VTFEANAGILHQNFWGILSKMKNKEIYTFDVCENTNNGRRVKQNLLLLL